jgi:hypothetical protein
MHRTTRTVHPAYRLFATPIKFYGLTVPQFVSAFLGLFILPAFGLWAPLPLPVRLFLMVPIAGLPFLLTTWATLRGTSVPALIGGALRYWASPGSYGPGLRTRGPRTLVLTEGPPPADEDADL